MKESNKLGTLTGIGIISGSCKQLDSLLKSDEVNHGTLSSAKKEQFMEILSSNDKRTRERPKREAADVPVKHEIQMIDSLTVSIPPRRLPHSQKEEIEKQIENLKEKGYVEKSQSPYSAPIVPVLKKDGSLRMCIDSRQLNAKTIPSVYPISRSDDILDSLNGSKVFTVLDLKEAYHQIAIKEEDKYKTAFAVPWEKLQWSRMPYGLIGAPYSLAACMNYALESCRSFAKGYYDDIIVYSTDMESHLVHLAHVMKCLVECRLQINYKKCDYTREEVNFVGHTVSKVGSKRASVKTDPSNTGNGGGVRFRRRKTCRS